MTRREKCGTIIIVKRISAAGIALLSIGVFVTPVLAAPHSQAVLGATVDTKNVNFPPVTSGPGFILPDSPLYILDSLKQTIKVSLSGSSLNRAVAHSEISGERMAELRIMVSRGNPEGITRALNGLTYETRVAAQNLADAAAQGNDVVKTAKNINSVIKLNRATLLSVEKQLTGGLAAQFTAARESMMESKLVAENTLPKEDLINEAKDDLAEVIDSSANNAAASARTLGNALTELSKTVTNEAAGLLLEKQTALKTATATKNQALIKKLTAELEAEKVRQDAILSAQNKALGDLKVASDNLQKAAVSVGTFQAVRLNPDAAVAGASTSAR